MTQQDQPAALVGVAIDVSGSMQTSMRNRSGAGRSRFATFHEALGRVVADSRKRAAELAQGGEAEALVFAYAFGLSVQLEVADLFALVAAAEGVADAAEIERLKRRFTEEARQRYAGYERLAGLARSFGFGREVDRAVDNAADGVRRQVVEEILSGVRPRLAKNPTATLTLTELARRWAAGSESFKDAEHFIFGGTPMKACMEQVADRFAAESPRLPPGTPRLLVLVSDGEPTDGDPRPALERIKAQGVFVASCLVTASDLGEPRRLHAEPRPEWPREAKLMFEAASAVEEDEAYREMLEGRGWSVPPNARLFAQINHSEMMEEFLATAFGRAQAQAPR